MSYITWSIGGYGICTSEIETTSEKIWELFKVSPTCEQYAIEWATELLESNNIRTLDMSIQEIKDRITLDDFEVEFFDPESRVTGLYLASILKYIIREKEGIRLLDCEDYDGNIFLIMPDAQVWQLNEKEKSMSMTDYDRMFAKYVKYLTNKDITVDYQEVQNGG